MNTSHGNSPAPQIAVWYFVGATFIFAASALFFPDADAWLRIVLLVVGFLVVVGGIIQLGREMSGRRDGSPRSEDPTEAAR